MINWIGLFHTKNPLDVRNIRFIVLFLNVASEAFAMCWIGTRISNEVPLMNNGIGLGDNNPERNFASTSKYTLNEHSSD